MSNKDKAIAALSQGPKSRDEVSQITGFGTQQANNALHGLKVDGIALKDTRTNLWGLTNLGTGAPMPVATPDGKLEIGDLLEVAGRLTDGTLVARTLEEQTMYTLYEL